MGACAVLTAGQGVEKAPMTMSTEGDGLLSFLSERQQLSRQSSIGSVVINAILPRRRCLEAQKHEEQNNYCNVWHGNQCWMSKRRMGLFFPTPLR